MPVGDEIISEIGKEAAKTVTKGIISAVFDFIKNWRKKPSGIPSNSPGILIIGPGGVGKTTLARVLSGEQSSILEPIGVVERSITFEETQLQGREDVSVITLPGQDRALVSSWKSALSQLVLGKYRGIILVSCYGYHKLPQASFKEHSTARDHPTKTAFLDKYLSDRRQAEINLLRDLANSISLTQGKIWLLSVVSKEDLWSESALEVREHYEQGEYSKVIHDIANAKGAELFHHEIAYGAMAIMNFATEQEPTLVKNTAGYDQVRLAKSVMSVFQIVYKLKGWEEHNS
ncbi:MAG: hypothetical protein ACRC8S_19595 [Fimbriiglobus sp.]